MSEVFKVDGSSQVNEYAFDAVSGELAVEFKSGRYVYHGVARETFGLMRRCHEDGGSVGKFINTHIKPFHRCERVAVVAARSE